MSTDGLELDGRGEHTSADGIVMFPVESQDSMSAPVLELEKGGEGRGAGDGQRYEVCFEATSSRTRRQRETEHLGGSLLRRRLNSNLQKTGSAKGKALVHGSGGEKSFSSLFRSVRLYHTSITCAFLLAIVHQFQI
ncbi:uncharacterized protein [Triticum aestivum]|uniref:uncharacterized protein isoform X1 n=1 Tax=Triticum aestivum TaxID=4565 RepID=UPI001D02BDEE|nr:uncharacterized protein LOC123162136 isoform X1 [Triticum aestivum]